MIKDTKEKHKIKYLTKQAKEKRSKIVSTFVNKMRKSLSSPVTCKKQDCFGCCYQIVGVPFFEGVIIAETLIRHRQISQLEALMAQGTEQFDLYNHKPIGFDPKQSRNVNQIWMDRSTKCVLLDKYNKCSIYGIRPAACATYFVCSPSKDCYPPSKKEVLVVNNEWVINQLMSLDQWYIRQLIPTDAPLTALLPLGHAVAAGGVLLTSGIKGLVTQYFEQDLNTQETAKLKANEKSTP